MDNSVLKSAVEFALKIDEQENIPLDTIKCVLSSFEVNDIRRAYKQAIKNVEKVGFADFMMRLCPERVVDKCSYGEGFHDYFANIYIDQRNFLSINSSTQQGIAVTNMQNVVSRNNYELGLKWEKIKSVLEFAGINEGEKDLYVLEKSVGPNRTVPYVYIEFEAYEKCLYFCIDYSQATYVLETGVDFSGELISDFKDEKVIFYGQNSPNLFYYQIIEKLDLDLYEQAKKELLDMIKLDFESFETLVETPVKVLSRQKVGGVSFLNIVEDIFKLSDRKTGTVRSEDKEKLAKLVWPEFDGECLNNFTEDEVSGIIKKHFVDLNEFINMPYEEFTSFKIGKSGWRSIVKFLNLDLDPVTLKVDRVKFGELLFQEKYEVMDLTELLKLIEVELDVDDFIGMGIRRLNEYRFGVERLSLLSIANRLLNEKNESLDLRLKAVIGKNVWGEKDEFVAELMTKQEWVAYIFTKYTKTEFQSLNLSSQKELTFSYHRVSSAFGFIGQRKKSSDIKKYIIEQVWGEV